MLTPRTVRRRAVVAAHGSYKRLPSSIRHPIWATASRHWPQLLVDAQSSSDVPFHAVPEISAEPSPVVARAAVPGTDPVIPELLAHVGRSLVRIERMLGGAGPDVVLELPDLSKPQVEPRQLGDVVWDLRAAQRPGHRERGISRYVHEQAVAFVRSHPEQISAFLTDSSVPIPGRAWPIVLTGAVESVAYHALTSSGFGEAVWYATAPLDSPHSTDVLPLPYCRPGQLWAATCYDLIPEIFPSHYLADPAVRAAYRARLATLRQAGKLLCISQSCASDVMRVLEVPAAQVEVIGAGVSTWFRPTANKDIAREAVQLAFPNIPPEYVMLPGGIDFRKNLHRAVEAYGSLDAQLRRRHHLVIVCNATSAERAALQAVARRAGVEATFHSTGYVSDATLRSLYQAAALVLFPSLYEGFGLPVVEALACHTPVICSDTSALIELVPDKRARFDPSDVRSIAQVLHRNLTHGLPYSPSDYESLTARHNWDLVAQRTSDALADLRRRGSARRPRSRRIAFCSPWPPARSGVADYSRRLVHALSTSAQVSVFSTDAAPGVHDLASFDAVEVIDGQFDAVVVAMGNSHFHVELLRFLRSHPGRCVVQLHDLRYTGLYAELDRANDEPARTSETAILASEYPLEYAQEILRRHPMSIREEAELGHWLNAELVGLARHVIIHSRYGEYQLRMEFPTSLVSYVPFSVPDLVPFDRESLKTAPLVLSTGLVHDGKDVATFIDAIELLRHRCPIRAALVGPGRLDATSASAATTRQLLRDGVLTVPGEVSDEEYRRWLGRASVAVQLRAYSNGEMSASIADALMARIPLVISANGPNADWPDEAVERVPQGATAEEVADAIHRWIGGIRDRDRAAQAAQEFCRERTFEAGAKALLQACFSR